MLVGQHLFGVTTLDQAAAHEGAQDAWAQIGLHLGHGSLVDSTGRVKTKVRRGKKHTRRCGLGIRINFTRHHLKHPVNYANMEMHMLVQTGAEPMNEGDYANVQGCLIDLRRTRAVGLQAFAQCLAGRYAAPY